MSTDDKNKKENNVIVLGETTTRIVRILIFVLLSFVLVRYALGIDLTDTEQIKIVLATSICFMAVNTFYPVIITRD
jgi:hypothetical protein